MIDFICIYCGTTYKNYKSRIGRTKFCSRSCQGSFKAVNYPSIPENKVTVFCKLCHVPFKVWPSKLAVGRGVFCSRSCEMKLYNPKQDVTERFFKYIDKTDTCWFWVGATNNKGYGCFNVDGKVVLAHRFSYTFFKGAIPTDKPCVCHNCPGGDNESCVNPDHLWAGTKTENNADYRYKQKHITNSDN